VSAAGLDAAIDEKYFVFKYSRSAGPGGQNVNKLNTRVTLLFDVPNCPDLSRLQKQRILEKLAPRIDKTGRLRVISQKYRTQAANRKDAIARFASLLAQALKTKRRRIRTAVPRAANERRLAKKRRKSEVKKLRTGPDLDA